MKIEAPGSANGTDCGVATTGLDEKNIFGQPLTYPVFVNPRDPGPEIDAGIRHVVDALHRKHPEMPESLIILGL